MRSAQLLKEKYSEQVAVDDDHCFAGFDAYKTRDRSRWTWC